MRAIGTFTLVAMVVAIPECDAARSSKGESDRPAPPAATATAAASAGSPWTQTETTLAFARKLADAADAHDAAGIAALYSEDATAQLAAGEPARGRAAIQQRYDAQLADFEDPRLRLGRVWVGRAASVIECTFEGTRRAGELLGVRVGEKRVGLNAAVVVHFDEHGLAKEQREYFDVATYLGQVEPKLLPAGFDKVRTVATGVPAGGDVLEPSGTPEESANLDVMNKVYLGFEAHALDDALAFLADDFVLEDFAAPAPERKADVRKHATAVGGALPDYAITRTLVLPAGDDVVVESSVQGTFTSAMGPIQPTGAPLSVHQLDVWRLKGGKIARQWSYSNDLDVLTQLGVVKR